MRISQGFFPTVKEVPADAVIPSHRLMLRAGLMRPLGAGIYSFYPLGYRAMKKAMAIVFLIGYRSLSGVDIFDF
jgi:prolyl-tRNA synthetase